MILLFKKKKKNRHHDLDISNATDFDRIQAEAINKSQSSIDKYVINN